MTLYGSMLEVICAICLVYMIVYAIAYTHFKTPHRRVSGNEPNIYHYRFNTNDGDI